MFARPLPGKQGRVRANQLWV